VLVFAWRILAGKPTRRRTCTPPQLVRSSRLSRFLNSRAYVGYVLCCAFAYSGIFASSPGSSYVLQEVVALDRSASASASPAWSSATYRNSAACRGSSGIDR